MATKKKGGGSICGASPEKIRKAYFGGKLSELFAEIMATGNVKEADVHELGAALERLKSEEGDFASQLREVYTGPIPGQEPKPPSVDELTEGVSDEEWREKADKAIAFVEATMAQVRDGIANKRKFEPSFWLDSATLINSYQGILDRDRVFRDQLYRARMTEIIDTYGVSRKEAEERARLTKEYADYKNAVLLRERCDEFINLCKKKDAEGSRPY